MQNDSKPLPVKANCQRTVVHFAISERRHVHTRTQLPQPCAAARSISAILAHDTQIPRNGVANKRRDAHAVAMKECFTAQSRQGQAHRPGLPLASEWPKAAAAKPWVHAYDLRARLGRIHATNVVNKSRDANVAAVKDFFTCHSRASHPPRWRGSGPSIHYGRVGKSTRNPTSFPCLVGNAAPGTNPRWRQPRVRVDVAIAHQVTANNRVPHIVIDRETYRRFTIYLNPSLVRKANATR